MLRDGSLLPPPSCPVPFPRQEIAPGQLSLEELLDMTDEQVCATLEKFGANSEECARLNASLSCLRSVHKSGELGALVPAGSP